MLESDALPLDLRRLRRAEKRRPRNGKRLVRQLPHAGHARRAVFRDRGPRGPVRGRVAQVLRLQGASAESGPVHQRPIRRSDQSASVCKAGRVRRRPAGSPVPSA